MTTTKAELEAAARLTKAQRRVLVALARGTHKLVWAWRPGEAVVEAPRLVPIPVGKRTRYTPVYPRTFWSLLNRELIGDPQSACDYREGFITQRGRTAIRNLFKD